MGSHLHNAAGPAGYKALGIEVPATHPRGRCRQGQRHHETLFTMSAPKNKTKTKPRLSPPLSTSMVEEALREFPNVPLPLLRMLNDYFSYDTPRETGYQLRKLWKLALFPTGNGLDAETMDDLSSLYILMEKLCDLPPCRRDAIAEMMN
jgi:hypothetical protein